MAARNNWAAILSGLIHIFLIGKGTKAIHMNIYNNAQTRKQSLSLLRDLVQIS